MSNAIQKASALAAQIKMPNLETVQDKIKRAEADIKHNNSLSESLLGIESFAHETYLQRMYNARAELERLNRESKDLGRLAKVARKYKRLSLDPLGWRDSDGFPALVVFTLKSPVFRIAVDTFGSDDGGLIYELPIRIAHCYKDVRKLLRKKAKKSFSGWELKCEFRGVIPKAVKEKIREARDTFGSSIFIIGEPGTWELNETVPLPMGDPLVVGYDEQADPNALWLIDEFDVTPVEEAAKHSSDRSSKN